MNHGIYRLVFDYEHNNWVAVAEFVRGHGKEKSVRRAGRSRRHAVALAMGAAAIFSSMTSALAAPDVTQLPIRSESALRPFIFHGSVSGGQPVTNGTTMTINQTTRTLGLNWDKFNIGKDATVRFNQPDSTSRVLNRIWDNSPSEIYGKLEANGQVYLINQNGILFGEGAQVNVGGLVASALNMSESMRNRLLDNGLPTTKGERLEFAYDGAVADFDKGSIVIEAGAAITTPSGGRVVLIAPKTVENEGIIQSGGGAEAILAAGGKVILTAPDDPDLRGLLVETQAFSGKDSLGNTVKLDGTATNSGTINTGSGGVATLAALAVNQKGLVSASKAVNINGTTMLVSGTTETDRTTINQRGSVAEVDWKSGFNVGTGKTVEVVQSAKGDVLYNYVNDTDRTAADGSTLDQAGRTTIDGTLKANGQFVLINEKGIDFGSNARVSASNFVASGLGMNADIVKTGLLGQRDVTKRAFYLNRNARTYNADTQSTVVDKAIQDFKQATVNVAAGAQIKSGNGGYVILAGSQVNQGGKVSSSNGQVLLAAGADLYLKPAFSSSLRGFSAEVNPLYAVDKGDANNPWLILSHNDFVNAVTNTGTVSVPLGDITLVGHEITQAGVLQTTTSATANGSIHLIARDQLASNGLNSDDEPTAASFWRQFNADGVVASTGSPVSDTASNVSDFIAGTVGGTLTFADGSQTSVDIDGSNGKTLTASQTFVKSSIDAVGRKIVVGNADVEATGGNIRFSAQDSFSEHTAFTVDKVAPKANTTSAPTGTGIFIADGAHIDASGADATKSVADLFIEVELRGDEFADNPVQRNGTLRGQTAWVDIRDDVKIANLESWFNNVGQTVFEKAATGGSISLGSTGSVIVKGGAELDVSGGTITYAAGTVKESFALTAGGVRYRLNDAPMNLRYSRLITRTHQEAEYVEGRSAGTVKVIGHSLALDGTMKAETTVGTRQREIGNPSSSRYAIPNGGQLIIQDAGQHFAVSDKELASDEEKLAAYTQAQIVFVNGAANAAAGLDADSAAGPQLELSDSLVSNGFSRFDITSDGRIDIPENVSLNLAAGGRFEASGRQIHVAGDISTPGGTITLKTRDMSTATGDDESLLSINDAKHSTLTLASTASLSTAGRWVNDYLDGPLSRTAKAIDGGDITLESAYDLDLQAGSRVNVSGGAYVSTDRKLSAGDAGSITLATGGAEDNGYNFNSDLEKRDATLFLDGTLSAYALGKGGTLTVKTSQISFGETFTADSRNWTRAERLAARQVGAAFDAGIVDRGGFFNFNFVGRDGVTVADGVRLSPDPVSWSLYGNHNWFRKTTGSNIASFATSSVLHPELRTAPTSLSLATRSLNFGDLLIGENAYVGVSTRGRIDLVSMAQLTVLGTLEAQAGEISLSRPATNEYDEAVDGDNKTYNTNRITFTEAKQSESIYLGENSKLLAGGTVELSESARLALQSGLSADDLRRNGQYTGSVLKGGSVTVDAGLGYLVTRQGSLIDVSGATGSLNVNTANGFASRSAQTMGSAGGNVTLGAREGMFLDGSYKAAGGSGALGGVFSLAFGHTSNNSGSFLWGLQSTTTDAQKALNADRQLTLYQSQEKDAAGKIIHTELWPGSANIDTATHNGKAALDLAALSSGGFGSLDLTSQHEMRFSGTIATTVNNQLRLDAPVFTANDGAQVTLTAAAARIGNSQLNAGSEETSAAIGNATATIKARDIGLLGTFTWNGFGTTTFASTGAIHFDSTQNDVTHRDNGRTYNGQMSASGDLVFSAARLSPSTYSDFRIDLLADSNSSITINRPAGSVADVSLSPAGYLEFAANTIKHDGTVTAPLGEIVFNAPGGKVTLGAGSVSSVSADRDLLFGYTTESGTTWQYLGTEITSLPTKGITIKGADTTVDTGATLDLSGGGEAVAWEFTTGPGGKTDVLDASSNTFAIIPGWNGFSSTDGALLAGYDSTTLNAGDTIKLGNNPAGLSGSYILLPARYALLPGAYLVTVKGSGTPQAKAQTQADGSWLVSGSISAANADGSTTAYSSAPLTVELATRSVVAQRAEYAITTASEFFYDTPGSTLAGDAGRLSAVGTDTLKFDPAVIAMRAAEVSAGDGRKRAGRGLELDLAAPKLLVSDGTTVADSGWSLIDQNKLNAIGASSLLLGGVRSTDGATTNIDTVASEIKVANSSKALTGTEMMFTATDAITVTSGSRIETQGSADARKVVLTDDIGDGAFLRAAEGSQATVSRSGTVAREKGNLLIEAGSTVAGKSLVFDATNVNALDGTVLLGARSADGTRGSGGAITIGAKRINVVADDSTPDDGLTLDNSNLNRFATADQIRLTSYSTVDLYGNAELGTSTLKELVIAAAGIAGHGDADNAATISARKVVLENPNFASAKYEAGTVDGQDDPVLGSGNLTVAAESIEIGDNATASERTAGTTGFGVRGFDDVTLKASGDVRFAGKGVTTIDNQENFGGSGNAANLTIDANRVVTVGSADHLLTASGAATISRNTDASGSTSDTGLGGALEMRAKSMDISGTVNAASGKLTLAGTDYLQVAQGASIAAQGTKVAFGNTYAYAPGGAIELRSDSGNISVESGASVSVSADAGGGNAGSLALVATNGTVSAAANTLHGTAHADANGASLTTDTKTAALDSLADAVSDGSFAGSWDIRARSGDLSLTKSIAAQNVSIAADNGSVTIASTGVIDASGDKGGEIALYSNNGDVILDGTLRARGNEVIANASNAGTRGQGGTVTLSANGTKTDSSPGKVITRSASEIDVGTAEGSAAAGGKVVFRADQSASIASADKLNIQLAGKINGARSISAEIVKDYTGASLKTGTTSGTGNNVAIGLNSIKSDLTTAYSAANMALLRAHLFGGSTDSIYHVTPGVEITSTSTGDFTIANDLDFNTLRFQGEAGALTIRARGNLKVNNSISDGFSSVTSAKANPSAASWSYRLVAGADTTAARLTTVNPAAASGNIDIAAGKLIRTGTGEIKLAAKGNIALGSNSVVYTAGYNPNRTVDNFTSIAASGENFLDGGGDMSISAGGDITQTTAGSFSNWLMKYDANGYPQWWTNLANFKNGFGAFGGGDIALSAGGTIRNVTAVIPTNGRVPVIDGKASANQAVIAGGGDLSVKSSGSIAGGVFYAETGKMQVEAGNSITPNSSGKAPELAIGNTTLRVSARDAITIGNIFNPMGALLTNSSGDAYRKRMFTYGNDSKVEIVSINGDIGVTSSASDLSGVAPSKVSIAALNGSIAGLTLLQMPGASGQLDLLAARDISLNSLTQYDIPEENIPSIGNPIGAVDSNDLASDPFKDKLSALMKHSSSLWHENDYETSRIIALTGDIKGPAGQSSRMVFNEAVSIEAGGNIENLNLDIQHAHASDVSRIVAGGNIRFDYLGTVDEVSNNNVTQSALGIQVGGPGRVEVIAGGDIDLADTGGIVTRGNLDNPFLPEAGASILAMAGVQVADPSAANYADYNSLLTHLQDAGIQAYFKAAKIDATDLAGMTPDELREVFFKVLREMGREAVATGNKTIYSDGRKLIAAFFPNTEGSGNDIKLSVSQIKTERGGDIQMLTPTGSVIVGVAKPTLTKDASKQGIFTIDGGDIYAMVEKNYLVNQSRTFTLDGGDVMLWSNHGDIDAGRGAKTQVATPPPVLVIRNGQIVVDTSNAVTGSGIGVLASQDDTPASDMDLFAPDGTIDAGDAGLRSTGNIKLGAAIILNSANISAGGAVSGAPAAVATAAPVTSVASPTETASKGSEEIAAATASKDEALGVLTVEVLDGGEAAPAGDKDDEKKKKANS